MNLLRSFFVGSLLVFSAVQVSAECTTKNEALDLNVGDVVSAELFNDILSRIQGVTEGMTVSELNGSWACEIFHTQSSGPAGYDLLAGWSLNEDGYGVSRNMDISFVKQTNETFKVYFPATTVSPFTSVDGAEVCFGRLVHDSFFGLSDTGVSGESCGPIGFREIKKVSSSCFVWSQANNQSMSCQKKNQPPTPATDLTFSFASGAISLLWTAPTGAISYEIHRKTSATGTFSSLGTSDNTSYSDSSVSIGRTYWYRVFAKNDNGTSTGSNVIKVTFNPSASLSSSSIGITDYLNGVASAESEHKIIYSTSSNTMTANLGVGKLDAENLNGLLAGSGGKSPVLKFTLANVPSAGMLGTATLSSKVLEGSDATLDSGERAITATVNVSWSSDGNKLSLTVPNQSSTVTLTGADGTAVAGTWDVGGSSDLMTISSNGINQPASLDVKLLEFLSSNIASSGPSIGDFFSAGDYFYEVGITGIDLTDASGNAFTKVQGSFGVDSNPTSVVYVDDVSVSEGLDLATVLVTLSTAVSDAVTLDYATAGSTATSGTDFTASSGSIRIAAGSRQGAFTVPLTNDSSSEGNETFTVSLSNLTNAAFGRSSATVTIVDNDSAS